jgi:hypothetical protein
LASEAAKKDAADGNHVGWQQAQEGEWDDDVECESGAEIDETEYSGKDGGQVDRIERNVEFPVRLEEISRLKCQHRTIGWTGKTLTCEIHFEKGKPLSLENAHSSREQVARAVILPEKTSRKTMMFSSNATPVFPVLLKSTWYGALELRALSRSPMQKSIVISMMIPRKTLRR